MMICFNGYMECPLYLFVLDMNSFLWAFHVSISPFIYKRFKPLKLLTNLEFEFVQQIRQ
jgi:hypothetical protein